MNVRLNIRLVYCYAFCINTIFVLPVLLPFFQNELGLTFQQLLMGEALFAAVVIAMEVPSGWMSDVWSRRGTLMVGCVFGIISFAGMMFASGFWPVMFFMAMMGVGVACNSGTVTSIIYDSLVMKGRADLYEKLEGKRHAISLYSVAFAAIVGGILFQINPRLPLFMDALTELAAFICAFFIVEPVRAKRAVQKHPLHDMWVTIKYAVHGHKEIAGIIIVSTVLFCTTKMSMWAQQPYMQYVGIPSSWFGYIMASGFLFGGAVGHFGHRINHALSNRHMIMILTGGTCVLMASAIALNIHMAIIFILMVSGVWGFGFPFVQNAINKYADPARRATILSTLGFLISLMFIPASLVMGYLDEQYSILHALGYVVAQLLILSAIGFWMWSRGTRLHLTISV